jgi:hypothetical protein
MSNHYHMVLDTPEPNLVPGMAWLKSTYTIRLIAEELRRNGWSEGDLLAQRKRDPAKLAIAARLRRETTLSLRAVSTRLCLGTTKSANGKLHELVKGGGQHNLPGQPQVTFKLEANET